MDHLLFLLTLLPAAYVSWVESELCIFADMFSRQVFPQGSVLGHGVAGQCVDIAMTHAQQVTGSVVTMVSMVVARVSVCHC